MIGSLDLEVADGRALARLRGELDASNAPDFTERLRAAGARVLVVDLAEVTYFDSAGVRMLDELCDGADVRIVAPAGTRARTTLRICAFPEDRIFESAAEAAA